MIKTITLHCDLFKCCEYNVDKRIVCLLHAETFECTTANDIDYVSALINVFNKSKYNK